MTTRGYRLLNAALLLALFAGSAWAYPRLPSRIPMHFDLAGRADRWEARSPGSWFFLPLTAAGLALFLYAVSAYGERHPESWNVPDKRRFLALDPAAQAPIIRRLQVFLAQVAVVITVLLGVLQAGAYHAVTGRARALPVWALAAIVAALLVMVAGGLRSNAEARTMIRDAQEPAPAP